MGGTTNLSDALFTKTQQRVLSILFGSPDRSFYLNEVIRLSGAGNGAVHRELARLLECGLVTAGLIGNQKHYQANRAAPIFDELRAIVLKTFGVADVLRARLQPLEDAIQVAFVYGSVARGTDKAGSDIDLMVVSDKVEYPDVLAVLEAGAGSLGREVNPSIYRRVEFEKKASEEGGFLGRVLEGPKLFLIGAESDIPNLERLVRSGELKAERFTRQEFDGLLRLAKEFLEDAQRVEISSGSRFSLAYGASHALATAALRVHGYRSANRYLVFQCLEHTAGLTPVQCRLFSLCHQRRNQAEYEGDVDIEEALLEGLTRATVDLFERVRSMSPRLADGGSD